MEYKTEKVIKLADHIYDARFHPRSESDVIAVATIAGDVQIIKSGVLNHTVEKLHKGSAIRKVRFLHNGDMVTIAKTIKIYDLQANQTKISLKRGSSRSMMYSLKTFDNNIICAGDDDGSVFVWDCRTPDEPVFTSADCEQYISDIDGKYEARKMIVCTSGEGTLTAYDLRANKMIEPQSELFEAGFQCVKMVEANKKVVIGAEDGGIYVFNHNEWGHTSGKFAIDSDHQNRGKCSVESIELLDDNQTFLAACSDGKVRALTLWPHKVLSERVFCRKSPLESIHVNPDREKSQMVISGENYINIVNFEYVDCDDEEDKESDDSSEEMASESDSQTRTADATTTSTDDSTESGQEPPTNKDQEEPIMPQSDMESSSGLIMNVIRILTNSKDDAERDVIKKKLEDFLKISDQNLTKLVSEHHKELRLVMQTFTSISSNIETSLTKLAKAKQRLKNSSEILTSRLDELKRLSDESKKNEKILALLDQIDELSRVPSRVNELLMNQEYLEATKLLIERQSYIEENFDSFDCMKEVRSDLDGKREEVYRVLKEKLFNIENEASRNDIIESLKLIDRTPDIDDLEVPKENLETTATTKPSLFKFSLSSHAICFNEHYKEQIEVTKTLMSK